MTQTPTPTIYTHEMIDRCASVLWGFVEVTGQGKRYTTKARLRDDVRRLLAGLPICDGGEWSDCAGAVVRATAKTLGWPRA
jgi:hypothetical protein